jgi:hypothetical protein
MSIFTTDEIAYIHDRLGYYTIESIARSMGRSVNSVKHIIVKTGGAPLFARDERGMSTCTAAAVLGAFPSAITRWIYDAQMPVIDVPKVYRIKGKPKPDYYIIDTYRLEDWLLDWNCLRAMNPEPGSRYYELIHSRRVDLKRMYIPTHTLKFLPVQQKTLNEWDRDQRYNIPFSLYRLHHKFYERQEMARWVGEQFGRKYRYMVEDIEW